MKSRSAARRTSAAIALATASMLALGCGSDRSAETTRPPIADKQLELSQGPTGRVKIYDPRRAWNGYTLTLHHGRLPVLLDMNGRSVHSWPGARVKSRVKLLADGSLLGLALGRSVVEYDWEGRLVWEYEVNPHLPHHDVIRLANGNTMFPILPDNGKVDEILEVDRAGTVVWRWQAGVYLRDFLSRQRPFQPRDLTHINSIQELPDNPWFRNGDERFRPGNILVSARHLDRVFIIDKATKKVTWSFGDVLDKQHEAIMLGPGMPNAGNITVLDNGYLSQESYRQSRVLEIEPTTNEIVRELRPDAFYTPTAGVQQPLANGNLLIGSSRGARIFEVDSEDRIVWQWTPPFEVVRPSRYPLDYCPQLAALGPPETVPIRPASGYRYIDPPLYEFMTLENRRKTRVEKKPQEVLAHNNDCQELLLPARPQLWVSWGVSRRRVTQAGRDSYAATFGLRYRLRDSERWIELLDETVDVAGKRWHQRSFDLADLDYQWIELCVETREVGAEPDARTEPFAFWNGPKISSLAAEEAEPGNELPADDLTPEEIETRRRHLEALGYLN